MATKVKLGDKITFTHTLERSTKRYVRNFFTKKEWIRVGIKPTDGIIIGIRTLINGDVDEDGFFFPNEYFRAHLVAYDLRKKPVYVKIEEDENRTRN